MIRVFDFFSGCGGTSLGFQNCGFEIIGALDYDKDSATTYKNNFPMAQFVQGDIRNIIPENLKPILKEKNNLPLLFSGCAPCQPFSTLKKGQKKEDSRRSLLTEFQRFVEYWLPDYIFLENVPGLQSIDDSDGPLKMFLQSLSKLKYTYESAIIDASDLGVPQRRRRFVLIAASSKRKIKSLSSIMEKNTKEPVTVREVIQDLPKINAGETHPLIPNHSAAKLSKINIQRIKKTPEGGDRRNWPKSLILGCHENYKGHTDVYGRMRWDTISSTLTTRCTSYSNGRFGHPEQDRAISVREAARLQTFPDNFIFYGSSLSCARQVGNAVPPLMAMKLSEAFI